MIIIHETSTINLKLCTSCMKLEPMNRKFRGGQNLVSINSIGFHIDQVENKSDMNSTRLLDWVESNVRVG